MAKKIRIYVDPYGNTLNMWWDDPKKAAISEEVGEAWDVLVKDKAGKYIGLEKIGFFPRQVDPTKYLNKEMKMMLKGEAQLLK